MSEIPILIETGVTYVRVAEVFGQLFAARNTNNLETVQSVK